MNFMTRCIRRFLGEFFYRQRLAYAPANMVISPETTPINDQNWNFNFTQLLNLGPRVYYNGLKEGELEFFVFWHEQLSQYRTFHWSINNS